MIVRTPSRPRGTIGKYYDRDPYLWESRTNANRTEGRLRVCSYESADVWARIFDGVFGRQYRSLADGHHGFPDDRRAAYVLLREIAYHTPDPFAAEKVFLECPLAARLRAWWHSTGRDSHRGMERIVLPALISRNRFWCDAVHPSLTSVGVRLATRFGGVSHQKKASESSLHSAFGQNFNPCVFKKAATQTADNGTVLGVEVLTAHTSKVTARLRVLASIFHHLSRGRKGSSFSAGLAQVACVLGIDKSTASRLIHRLEDASVIKRISTGNQFSGKVSEFRWLGFGNSEVTVRPQPEEESVRVDDAHRLAAGGQLPAGAERLGDELAIIAGAAWNLAGGRVGGEFRLGAAVLAELCKCSPATAGRRLRRLLDLGVIRVVRPASHHRHTVTAYAWVGIPPA